MGSKIVGTVYHNDRGLNNILRDIKKLNNAHTKIGVQTDAKPRKEGKATNIEIGIWNEFGTKRIPERPHHRKNFDENLKATKTLTAKLYKKVQQQRYTPKKALGLLGEWYLSKLKNTIVELNNPVNAPSTILNKKSSNPLIDTSQYLNSQQHVEVVK